MNYHIKILILFVIFIKTHSLIALTFNKGVFSQDDKSIYFSINDNKNEFIYNFNFEQKKLNQITKNTNENQFDFFPSISPNGTKIVFTSIRNNKNSQIFIMDYDGNNQKLLYSDQFYNSEPIFSSNGGKVYFLQYKKFLNYSPIARAYGHDWDICCIDIDGNNFKRITDNKYYLLSNISIFPDNKTLFFELNDTSSINYSLWKINLENILKISPVKPNLKSFISDKAIEYAKTESLYNSFYYPNLSPDGKQLLFTWPGIYQGYFGHEIYLLKLDSNTTEKLTNMRTYIKFPIFSKDNTKILFLAAKNYNPNKKSEFDFCIIDTSGKNLITLDIKL